MLCMASFEYLLWSVYVDQATTLLFSIFDLLSLCCWV